MYNSNKNDCAQWTIVISKRNTNIKKQQPIANQTRIINISNYSGER